VSEKTSYRYTAVYSIVLMFRNFYGSSGYTDGKSPPTIDAEMETVEANFKEASVTRLRRPTIGVDVQLESRRGSDRSVS
jgi:hypothetical protein